MPKDDSIKSKHPAYDTILRKVQFWRMAANGFEKQMLRKYKYESSEHFDDRKSLCHDTGYTAVILESMTGHFRRAEVKVTNIDDKTYEAIEHNIDGKGTSLQQFASEIFTEILTVAECTLFTDSSPEGQIRTCIMPRETIIDWVYSDTGYSLLKWCAAKTYVKDLKSAVQEYYYLYTPEIRIRAHEDIIEQDDNPLGFIPAHYARWSNGTNSYIDPIARVQHSTFNLLSEWRSILRDQGGLNLLKVPAGVDLQRLTASSVIVIPDDAKHEPGWVQYPSSGLEAHSTYFKMCQDYIAHYSRMRTLLDDQSGEAKKVDFMELESILINISGEVEKVLAQAINDWGAYQGVTLDAEVNIDKSFLSKEALDNLAELLQLKAIGIPTETFDQIQNDVIKRLYGIEVAADKQVKETLQAEVISE